MSGALLLVTQEIYTCFAMQAVVNREVKGACGGVLDAYLEVLFLRSLLWLPCSSLLPAFSHCYTSSTLI